VKPVDADDQPLVEEVELLLNELSKFDKRTERSIPLAALQMTVDAILGQGLPVERTKLLVDRYCKRVTDGRIDYSALYNLWMSQYEGSEAASSVGEGGYLPADASAPSAESRGIWIREAAPGQGQAVTTPDVQKLYAQWGLGQIDAHTLIDRLNTLPEIREIGGVSPSCYRRILDHQFDHDLLYKDFLRALRNTGPPEFVPDRLDLASMKKSRKKIFENPPGQESQSRDVLFPPAVSDEDRKNAPVISVVSGKAVRQNQETANRGASDGVATALTATEHLVDGMQVTWTPTHGEKVTAPPEYGGGVGQIGDGDEAVAGAVRERKHFSAKDQVGDLFAMHPDDPQVVERPAKTPIPIRSGNMSSVLFGGAGSVEDTTIGVGRPGMAGVGIGGEKPIGKKTYYGASANLLGGGQRNHDIAVGSRVNEASLATTQELLWGNMIRRAR
jgi:hypothetical protein